MPRPSTERALLLLILFVYLVVAGLFAIGTPAWQAPDEPAHYNYIAQVADNGCCPIIQIGDWNQAYLSQLTTAHFKPELLGDLSKIQYEDHQPPTYYLLASLVFKLSDGSLIVLRLFSVLLGTGVVWSAYAVGKVVLPERPAVALGAAAFVAFLPQHLAMLAAVNNDTLSELIIGVTLLFTVRYLKMPASLRPSPTPLLLGIFVGIGLITKASAYFLAGIVPLAIFLRWWATQEKASRDFRPLARDLALFLVPALIFGAIWWIRDFNVYGFPDFLGLRAHNLVVADQPRTADHIAAVGWGAYLREGLQTTFDSFWGQFGWMALPMPGWIYTALVIFLLVVLVGLILDYLLFRRGETLRLEQRSVWIILWLTLLLAGVQYIYYNSEFLQLQGRYLFPGLFPFGLLVALGLDAWRQRLLKRWVWLTAVIVLPFAALDVYLLARFIVPLLSP
jgi:4-amino-4-deoxy-L-arabinose transferase-like glycosyltransferase